LRAFGPQPREADVQQKLSDLKMRAFEFLLDHLHLVFEAKFEFFQANFFQLLIVTKISFFDQGVEPLGVLGVFMRQPTKLSVAGKELFANGIYHPEEPPAVLSGKLTHAAG
jgi:hypothetical protein